MMRLSALFVLSFLFVSSYGQNATRPVGPYVTLGNIPAKFTNGKADASNVTRTEILANPQLIASPSIEVVEFTFSMLPKGRDFVGPYTVKGTRLTPEIIQKIQELENPQAKIFFENIRVKENDGTIRHMSPILLNMVLK